MQLRCIELTDSAQVRESRAGDWKFDVRRDGCIHIKRFHNGSRVDALDNPDMDYLHVCNLEDFISTLLSLAEDTKTYRRSM
jgi:hypothetical protein